MKTEEMPKVSVWEVPESTVAGEKMQLFLHAEIPGLALAEGMQLCVSPGARDPRC